MVPVYNSTTETRTMSETEGQPGARKAGPWYDEQGRSKWHDEKGHFLPGNPGGPGNPVARDMARVRGWLRDWATPKIFHRVAKQLVRLCYKGHYPAIKLFISYA